MLANDEECAMGCDMKRITPALLLLAVTLTGCKAKSETANAAPTAPPPAAPAKAVDGSRIVQMEAAATYKPAVITAAPNEKLTLAIRRTADGCIETFKVPGAAPVKLEKNKVMELKVTAPASGELLFGCDMEHCHEGKIVVAAK